MAKDERDGDLLNVESPPAGPKKLQVSLVIIPLTPGWLSEYCLDLPGIYVKISGKIGIGFCWLPAQHFCRLFFLKMQGRGMKKKTSSSIGSL